MSVVPVRSSLSLASAEAIATGALEYGSAAGLLPLAIAILDSGGHLVLAKRQDGAGILRMQVALGKAWGALGMGLAGAEMAERFAGSPNFANALIAASNGRLVPGAGGVLIADDAGHAIGAVGISGDTGDRDEEAALQGIRRAGRQSFPPA